LSINRGISEQKLEALYGAPPRHEFTALRDHATNRCVSYYFANYYAETSKRRAQNREIQTLVQRFDPYRAQLGMKIREIEKAYDAPNLKETLHDASEMRYYGSPKLGTDTSFMDTALLWVAVLFMDEKVIAVFTDAFFNHHKIEKRQ